MSLYEKLISYTDSDILPMHMPGHKRNPEFSGALPYSLDITEVEGFDDLHHRTGVLGELSARMAKLRRAAAAFPIVCGSTAGVSAAIRAMTHPGDTVIMVRNCHKSVYHAVELCAVKPVYVFPPSDEEFGFDYPVEPEAIEQALEENPGAKLVILTSPTYEGMVSDIRSISDIAHSRGARVFVDAAHGAHLGYGVSYPSDALSRGADAVVESLHKTLPAMTMTSALYINDEMNSEDFERALDIFETSSPSYVLLASVDRCVTLLEERSTELFAAYRQNLNMFDEVISGLKVLQVPGHTSELNVFAFDSGKIIISAKKAGIPAGDIAEKLRIAYHIEPEMVCRDYLVCITSICDTKESLLRLADALLDIDLSLAESKTPLEAPLTYPKPRISMSVNEAMNLRGEYIPFKAASGRISMTYLWAYPPGIPIVVPGEIITEQVLNCIGKMKKSGIEVRAYGTNKSGEIFVKTETEK